MKSYNLVAVLCLVLVPAAEVTAVQVTPGYLELGGRMYGECDDPFVCGPPGWGDIMFGGWGFEHPGDPQDLMYSAGEGYPPNWMGIREGVYEIPAGTYETTGVQLLGGHIYAMELRIESWWESEPKNLLFEVRSTWGEDV